MRHPRRSIPAQPIQHLWERQKEIARMVVMGLKPIEIAKEIGMTPTRLSIVMNSPIFKEYVQGLSNERNEAAIDVSHRLQQIAQDATDLLENVLLNKEPASINTRVRIAQDFLDRAGYGKTTINRNENINVSLTGSKIDELKKKRAEMLAAINIPLLPSQSQQA